MMMTMAAFCLPMATKQNGGGQHSHFPYFLFFILSLFFSFGDVYTFAAISENPEESKINRVKTEFFRLASKIHKNLRKSTQNPVKIDQKATNSTSNPWHFTFKKKNPKILTHFRESLQIAQKPTELSRTFENLWPQNGLNLREISRSFENLGRIPSTTGKNLEARWQNPPESVENCWTIRKNPIRGSWKLIVSIWMGLSCSSSSSSSSSSSLFYCPSSLPHLSSFHPLILLILAA